jgi:hypothetical protein
MLLQNPEFDGMHKHMDGTKRAGQSVVDDDPAGGWRSRKNGLLGDPRDDEAVRHVFATSPCVI